MNSKQENPAVGRIDEKICLWAELSSQARAMLAEEPEFSRMLHRFVLDHENFSSALGARLAHKLASNEQELQTITAFCTNALTHDEKIACQCQNDILATATRDAACESVLAPLLWFKGFLALAAYRISHFYWTHNRCHVAYFFQSKMSEKLAVDIHPAAKIGCGIMLDHATGFVAGETAVVENNVSILHAVTLGGTGKSRGDRHPKVCSGVLIGAGAKILGNIEIGKCAKIGAGSVVLENVPAHATVAGVPAKIIGMAQEADPAIDMNHYLPC